MCLSYREPCSLHTVIVFYDLLPAATAPPLQPELMFPSCASEKKAPHRERFGLGLGNRGPRLSWPADSARRRHSCTRQHGPPPTSLPNVGVGQTALFAGAGLALLQTVGVTGLAAQIADGLVEAVRQHGQLAAVTQGAGSAARAATMLAAVGLLEAEETH